MIECLPKPLHEAVRKALRQVWELNDADRALRAKHLVASCVDANADMVVTCILSTSNGL